MNTGLTQVLTNGTSTNLYGLRKICEYNTTDSSERNRDMTESLNSTNKMEKKIRNFFIFLIVASLFLPFGNTNDYLPNINFILFGPLLALVDGNWPSIVNNPWFYLTEIIFFVSLWAGPILALSNILILSNVTKRLVWFNRIMIPIFLISLIERGDVSTIQGKTFNYGYWGYVFVVFLGGIAEAIFYFWEKKEKETA